MERQCWHTWQEKSPGIFSRPLDEPELYYKTNVKIWEGSGRTASAITAHIGISLDSSWNDETSALPDRVENSLRYAWKHIRYQHPILASTVDLDPKTGNLQRIYQIGNEDVLEDWMRRTLTVIRTGQSSAEFMSSDPPVPNAAIFIFPEAEKGKGEYMRYNIVFRCQHDIIDGLATYAVLENLIRYAAHAFHFHYADLDVPFGDEHNNLSPPFRTVLGLPPASEHTFTQSEINQMQYERTKDRKDGLSIPYKTGALDPGQTHLVVCSLTIDETQRVLAACKLQHTTVTQVIHAAIALAVRDLQPKDAVSREGKYVSYTIANLRRFGKPPYNGHPMMACHINSTSSLIVRLTIPPETKTTPAQSPGEFKQTLEQVQNFYQTKAVPTNLLEAALCFTARTLPYPTEPCAVPLPATAPSVVLSSRGIVDHYIQTKYGPFEIHEPWCVSTELSPGIGVSVATWKGVMCLRATYNTVFQGPENVQTFLGSVKRVVMQGLDIF